MIPLILGALALGSAGGFFLHKKLSSGDKELYKTQAECLKLAREGKIPISECLKLGRHSFLSELADVTEEVGKVIVGATAAYAVTKLLKRRK
jgi:hypothetical protein